MTMTCEAGTDLRSSETVPRAMMRSPSARSANVTSVALVSDLLAGREFFVSRLIAQRNSDHRAGVGLDGQLFRRRIDGFNFANRMFGGDVRIGRLRTGRGRSQSVISPIAAAKKNVLITCPFCPVK